MTEMQKDVMENKLPEEKKVPAENEKKQNLYQLVTMIACVVTAVVVLVSAVILVPKTVVTMNQAQETMTQVNSMAGEAEGMFEDLNAISESLNSFVNGEDNNGTTLGDLDIETLNDSIQKLQAIVEPLAKLFGYGK